MGTLAHDNRLARDPVADTHALAEALVGTAMTEQQALAQCGLDAFYDGVPDGHEELFDGIVFYCEGCGWWCRTDEEANDAPDGHGFLCDDCNDEQQDD